MYHLVDYFIILYHTYGVSGHCHYKLSLHGKKLFGVSSKFILIPLKKKLNHIQVWNNIRGNKQSIRCLVAVFSCALKKNTYVLTNILKHISSIICKVYVKYNFNCSVLFNITFKINNLYFRCTKLQLHHYKYIITNKSLFKYMTYTFQ